MKKIKTNSKKKKRKKSGQKKEKAKPEETKLEEEIRQAEKEIEQETENPEQEFFESARTIPIQTGTSAPVLERIIQRQEQIPVEQSANPQEERRERRIDYSPASNQPNYGFERTTEENEEKKYESTFVPPILSRREIQTEGMRQEFLHPSGEAWQKGANENQLGGIDIIEKETRLPFEEQKKYKRFKLR